MAERGTLLVEVSSIQPDDNVTVAQTTVIGFKIADVFKLAFGHVVDGSWEEGQGFYIAAADTSGESTCPPNQHESPEKEREKL